MDKSLPVPNVVSRQKKQNNCRCPLERRTTVVRVNTMTIMMTITTLMTTLLPEVSVDLVELLTPTVRLVFLSDFENFYKLGWLGMIPHPFISKTKKKTLYFCTQALSHCCFLWSFNTYLLQIISTSTHSHRYYKNIQVTLGR